MRSFRVLALASVSMCVVFIVGCTKGGESTSTSANIPAAPTPIPHSTKFAVEKKPFAYCADYALCPTLRDSEEKCSKSNRESDCKEFVTTFEKLAVKKDCKRTFDTEPVSSVWVCGDLAPGTAPNLHERSANTLSKLKFPFARKFYGTDEFRSTLDGAVAEDHYDKSVEVGRSLKK